MYDPERYETNKSAAARDAAQFVPLLVKDMGPWAQKETILDYGCGAGSTGNWYILPEAEKKDSKILAVDISPDMIAHAREKYGNARVRFEVGDILGNFPYDGVKFDRIFAVYVLHFVRNYREALKRFYELLKPGGYFGFTVLSKSTLYILHERMGKSEKWGKYMEGWEKYVPEWFEQKEDSVSAFKRNLGEIGFEIVKLGPHMQEYDFPHVDTIAELYVSLNPFVKKIPKEMIPELKKEYSDFQRQHWKVPEGTDQVRTKYELLYGVVRKPVQ